VGIRRGGGRGGEDFSRKIGEGKGGASSILKIMEEKEKKKKGRRAGVLIFAKRFGKERKYYYLGSKFSSAKGVQGYTGEKSGRGAVVASAKKKSSRTRGKGTFLCFSGGDSEEGGRKRKSGR